MSCRAKRCEERWREDSLLLSQYAQRKLSCETAAESFWRGAEFHNTQPTALPLQPSHASLNSVWFHFSCFTLKDFFFLNCIHAKSTASRELKCWRSQFILTFPSCRGISLAEDNGGWKDSPVGLQPEIYPRYEFIGQSKLDLQRWLMKDKVRRV